MLKFIDWLLHIADVENCHTWHLGKIESTFWEFWNVWNKEKKMKKGYLKLCLPRDSDLQ